MATFAAPLVDQLSVVLEPKVMLVGLALKELIAGKRPGFTVTACVEVTEPALSVAVSV
jgi:hypothetical protein